MSITIEPIRESAAALKSRRKRLLRSVDAESTTELVERAGRRVLTDQEEAVAYQLEGIAFLLGEEPLRIR